MFRLHDIASHQWILVVDSVRALAAGTAINVNADSGLFGFPSARTGLQRGVALASAVTQGNEGNRIATTGSRV
jgi:hypothetical protein